MGAEYTGEREAGLRARLTAGGGAPLLLDGATGTELERRGLRCELPLWSTHALLEAPEAVREVHADYARAGAELLTANTFRTQRRALARAGLGERAEALTRLAVELARDAAHESGGRPAWVAGSMPTLEDCYRPDLVPETEALAREHTEHATSLADAGVDLILVETMNSVREAVAAAQAAAATGRPFIVSFVSWTQARLLSGEPLAGALDAVLEWRPLAVGVNCLPPSAVASCLEILRGCGRPFGVYANQGAPTDAGGFERSEACSPQEFAQWCAGWADAGARYLGGCCGTGPDHVRAIARALSRPH